MVAAMLAALALVVAVMSLAISGLNYWSSGLRVRVQGSTPQFNSVFVELTVRNRGAAVTVDDVGLRYRAGWRRHPTQWQTTYQDDAANFEEFGVPTQLAPRVGNKQFFIDGSRLLSTLGADSTKVRPVAVVEGRRRFGYRRVRLRKPDPASFE